MLAAELELLRKEAGGKFFGDDTTAAQSLDTNDYQAELAATFTSRSNL